MGWTCAVLIRNIQSNSYEQYGLTSKQHNFKQALPKHQAEQADQAIKDVYLLDILGVEEPILEREMESRIFLQKFVTSCWSCQGKLSTGSNAYTGLLGTALSTTDDRILSAKK